MKFFIFRVSKLDAFSEKRSLMLEIAKVQENTFRDHLNYPVHVVFIFRFHKNSVIIF